MFNRFFFSSRRRHTRFDCDWSSDVCSSDLPTVLAAMARTLDAAAGGRLELGLASDRVEGTEEYAPALPDLLAGGPPLSIAIAGPPGIGRAVRFAHDVVDPASALADRPRLIR